MESSGRESSPTDSGSDGSNSSNGNGNEKPAVTLEDKYLKPKGRVYMTGTQALVRMLLAQKLRDEAAGLNTGGFVSGYRGSPLGAVDQELWKAKRHLAGSNIKFVPGLNEELAATAVWGTQMVNLDPNATVDGVFALWYGKGPGVDRSGDVFKHGNIAGTSRHGGVLVIAGDDHSCKSSSLPHQSEHAFIAAMMPALNPSGVREFVEFGLHGWAMSRYSGCWVGFKAITDTIETSASFEIDPLAVPITIPDTYPIPPDGFSIRWPDAPLAQENRLQRERLYALLEYVRVNGLNRQPWHAPDAKLGIATTGKSYLDTLEALALLGLDETTAACAGIRLLKIGVSWPLEPQCVREFAEGLSEILVVEEKRQIIEYQIKEQLYNEPVASRPRVVGKYSEAGEWVQVPKDGILLSPNGELAPATIAAVIAARLARIVGGALPATVSKFLLPDHCAMAAHASMDPTLPARVPYFCSGCPHNTSTKVPDGSRAVAGIGCHFMVMWMDRRTETFTQMGGEGVTWIGQAPFTSTPHLFANLGDGTYMHSGSLAIRASVAAGVNITYKILYNDAVAMTGGQPVEGAPSPLQILQQLAAEGVKQVHLVSDDIEQFADATLPAGTRLLHRSEMDALQRELREVKGVTAIVYVQTCAAEKRRRRKQKKLADPARRVLINHQVCEGCGDCGVQSNCVSIVPFETELGRKRTIDQSACNKDYSCVNGFCPSFVTVEGGKLRAATRTRAAAPTGLPAPLQRPLERPFNILVTGVGGTGVVTIGALLGMAAHIESKGVLVLDMAGMAQKGGAVMSHVRIGASPRDLHAARVAANEADLILGCDMMVAAGSDAIAMANRSRTIALLNTDVAPTGAFARDPDWQASPDGLRAQVAANVSVVESVQATSIATALLGDGVATNMFLLGFAWQKGWIPLTEASLLQAIELNGAAVTMNKEAFAWGRQAALDLAVVREAAGMEKLAPVLFMPSRSKSLARIVEDRIARLIAYQNRRYADRYEAFVNRVAAIERERVGGDAFTREVAVSLYKLMAYKDEYEVARLYTDGEFEATVKARFEGEVSLKFHLAPPLFAKRDEQGRLIKRQYGPWMMTAFRALAACRRLRGTALDPFGYSEERRHERAAIEDFRALAMQLAQQLNGDNLKTALELAALPQSLRGFGHVKERNAEAVAGKRTRLLSEFGQGGGIAHSEGETVAQALELNG
ncbi:indolepyruvate ferredoxin oxidoreductase family protein [Paraburkholderia antibiotica]|uniref:Indolepyruvate ferredoxin oxidoreductase family protein n=1 Tax=Paraburkholderia antibiotica TaxID=2728839 RepID=A0A7X9X5B3_9BURK|nr:indolepyruvate ferredoxin oxidoreductase family protein [Paraburkholderia antibiotica]NML31724.1 indolepyruvate ferredoxin oxidoreductase family protein [Paraburkholderia antibiotica]